MFDPFGLKQAAYWLHTALDYIIAGGLVAFGVYTAMYWQNRFARIVGIMIMGCGIGWGCFAYGKTIGGSAILEQWSEANKQAKADAEKRDIAIAKLAREMAEQQAGELAKQNFDLQKKVDDYEESVKNAPDCRRATADDIRRLCGIVGSGSPGCKGAK